MTDFMMKFCWPRNVVLWTGAGGGDRMRYELQLQMWGRVKNVSKENVFLHSSKLVFFFFDRWKAKKAAIDEKRKKMIEAMLFFRRIDPVPSFFSFLVKSFTSSWLHRRLMVVKFSNFCIVFFIFQRVQSLRGSKRVEWLHVDGYLSKIKLELVVDNPILLRWDIKYVFVAEDAINIQTDILPTSKSLLLFASWDSLSSYFAGENLKMLFFFFCLIVGMICSSRM